MERKSQAQITADDFKARMERFEVSIRGKSFSLDEMNFLRNEMASSIAMVEDSLRLCCKEPLGIMVNGRERAVVYGQHVSYEDIVGWQVQEGGRRGLYTVVWSIKGGHRQGSLTPGQHVVAEPGLRISAVITDNA
jgi:hypothetical protein